MYKQIILSFVFMNWRSENGLTLPYSFFNSTWSWKWSLKQIFYFYNPDVNLYDKTVIDYFGGKYGIYWPSKSHICKIGGNFSSVNYFTTPFNTN